MTGFRFMQQMLESSNTGRGEVPRGGLHKASLDRSSIERDGKATGIGNG